MPGFRTSRGRQARRGVLGVLLFLMFLCPGNLSAQTPDRKWRTIELPRHRIHFPAEAEPWARHLARRLESLHEAVTGLVGWEPEERIDVVLRDPVGRPNGFAWALPGRPRMVLWATPPGAGSSLAFFRDWSELLAGHEQTHLVHLLRPSRNRWERWLSWVLPLTPIARKAPRWVTEGYATLLEGRITGRGRPHSVLRAALLREWARRGRLPAYEQLSGDDERWLGRAVPYLVGSAYLQWLEEGVDPGSLSRLWRRMTARRARSFEEAFRGVFGEDPEPLYDRFRAELIHRSLRVEERLQGLSRSGELWQDFGWGTGTPEVSPGGGRIVFLRTGRDRPPRLMVISTAPDPRAEALRRRRIRETMVRDPEDVAPVDAGPLPREPSAVLELRQADRDAVPRWLPDGSVLFSKSVPDRRGVLHRDLFRWRVEEGRVERVTRGADVRRVDPAPGGFWAVGVRTRWGVTELVRIDLREGAVTEVLVSGRIGVLVDSPRVSPEGSRIAYLQHAGPGWELRIRDLESDRDRRVPASGTSLLSHPVWHPGGGHLYVAIGRDGLLDLHALPVREGARGHRVTRTLGGAWGPAPTPDGKELYFLSPDADGVDLRKLSLDAATLQDLEIELPSGLVPAIPPYPAGPIPLEEAEVPEARGYGLGDPEVTWLTGGSAAPSGTGFEAGLRWGDLLGRWSVVGLAGGAGQGGVSGFLLGGAWRGWPLEAGLRIYRSEERYSEQPQPVSAGPELLDVDETGVTASVTGDRILMDSRWSFDLAGGWSSLEPRAGEEELERRRGRLFLGWEDDWERGLWDLAVRVSGEGEVGRTAGRSWDRRTGALELTVGRRDHALRLRGEFQSLEGDPTPFDRLRLGGVASSLRPPLAEGHRLLEPALPAGLAFGDRSRSFGVSYRPSGIPAGPFWARHRVWTVGEPRGEWIDLAGVELRLDTERIPLVGLPGADIRAGGAYLFDGSLEGETTGWLALAWRP